MALGGGLLLLSLAFPGGIPKTVIWFLLERAGWGNTIHVSSDNGAMAYRFEIYGDSGMTMQYEHPAINSAAIRRTRDFAQYLSGAGTKVYCVSFGETPDIQSADFLREYNAQHNANGMHHPRNIAGAPMLSGSLFFMTDQYYVVNDGYSPLTHD